MGFDLVTVYTIRGGVAPNRNAWRAIRRYCDFLAGRNGPEEVRLGTDRELGLVARHDEQHPVAGPYRKNVWGCERRLLRFVYDKNVMLIG